MSGGVFVHCPGCGRLMLGQERGGITYPQPHGCDADRSDFQEERRGQE